MWQCTHTCAVKKIMHAKEIHLLHLVCTILSKKDITPSCRRIKVFTFEFIFIFECFTMSLTLRTVTACIEDNPHHIIYYSYVSLMKQQTVWNTCSNTAVLSQSENSRCIKFDRLDLNENFDLLQYAAGKKKLLCCYILTVFFNAVNLKIQFIYSSRLIYVFRQMLQRGIYNCSAF